MAILVIGGSGRNVGKTTVICSLIRELVDFGWTAIKVSAHSHRPEPVWEEDTAGQGSDTARYLAAGARRALLVSAPDGGTPTGEIRAAIGSDVNVILESNRIVDYLQPDLALAIIGSEDDIKPSFASFLRRADAVLVGVEWNAASANLLAMPVFRLRGFDRVSPELIAWVRERLQGQARKS